ncbi:MAG: hypothetical protein WBB67_11465 [bacterium]
MKKILIVIAILMFVVAADAKRYRSLVEVEPKASLYIGSVRFGLGCDVIFNPLKTVGFRFSGTELSFGDNSTQFGLNFSFLNSSLDALIYFPMRGMQPYVHTGIGFLVLDTDPGGSNTFFTIRGGLGLTYPWNRGSNLFVEPGVIITDPGDWGDTDVIFRLSVGGRFGLLK